jgi:hypothetical protein
MASVAISGRTFKHMVNVATSADNIDVFTGQFKNG